MTTRRSSCRRSSRPRVGSNRAHRQEGEQAAALDRAVGEPALSEMMEESGSARVPAVRLADGPLVEPDLASVVSELPRLDLLLPSSLNRSEK